MTFAPIRRPRLNQPNGDGIDWSNPITRNLVSAIGLGTLYDAAASKSLTGTVTGTKTVAGGRGFGTTDGSGTSDKVPTTLAASTGPASYFVRAKLIGWGGGSAGRLFQSTSGGFEALYIQNAVSSGLVYVRAFTGSRSAFTNSAASVSDNFGKIACYSVSFDASSPSNEPELYINGVRFPFATFDSLPTGSAVAGGSIAIGNSTAGTKNADGIIYDLYSFRGMLSSDQHKSLAANPHQIYL